MKKRLSLFFLVTIVIITMAGCSNEKASQKSKDALRAEVKAEMEAEAKLKEEIRKELEAELKKENKEQEKTDKDNKIEKENSSISKNKSPLAFEKVYKGQVGVVNGQGLLPAIEYFYENYDDFQEASGKEFAKKIFEVIDKDKATFQMLKDNLHINSGYMGTLEARYVNSMYDYYNIDTNEFNKGYFDGDTRAMIDFILESDIYTLAKHFYATEGYVEDNGFCVTIKPEIFEKLKPAVNIVYPDRYRENDYFDLEPIYVPNMVFSSIDEIIKTDIVYPNVYITDSKQVFLFEHDKIWKTTIILPVKVVNNKPSSQAQTNQTANGIEEENSDAGIDYKLSGFTAETVNDEYIDYSKYMAVVVPMYSGTNLSSLSRETCSFSDDINNTKVTFSVFGEMQDINVTYYENMESTGEVESVGTISNAYLDIYAPFGSDMSYVKVTGKIHRGEGYFTNIEFTLDDMRDTTDYTVYKYE